MGGRGSASGGKAAGGTSGGAATGTAATVAALAKATSREAAHALVANVKGKALDALARHYGVPANHSSGRRSGIVEQAVGYRLDTAAIRGTATLPY